MDGGGRLDQPLTRSRPDAAEDLGAPIAGRSHPRAFDRFAGFTNYRRRFGRWRSRIVRAPPSGVGVAASALLLAATLGYGVIAGNHAAEVVAWLKDARDEAASALGFGIAAVSLTGPKEVSREEVLATAGVTARASLLFLDADAARARLMANPWIADAAILKLYPDRLQITVIERQAFALWQENGRLSVIAADGTVLEPFVENRYRSLPLVVGRGAERQAKDFLAIVDRYPDIHALVRASILVAQRRWNLRLTNGIDVRLPEGNVAPALDRLVALDREKKLLSRDIVAVDLRLPDRVSVQLSDAAAQAREDALKAKDKKKKGGDA
ncbi:MAG: cell division protein FtsQ/DivIB [Hyphomicrobiales bacterium]|nr:cell division protein FtsQ/DivIB [Hyphomicrobiales bacterium]MDE2286457.1 cell division protein FtsQ/DivIB [Hyphomicrobiales bacterium]MDE2373166.1 cell division protein FtsQ/DivIB [Hyphomicrobiales bacterium]